MASYLRCAWSNPQPKFKAQRVGDLISANVQTDHVTEPVSALVAACHELDITRRGLISPYVAGVAD